MKTLSWQAPEFDYHPKSKTWLAIATAVAAVIALWGIFNHNYLFVLIVALGLFSVISYGFKKPRLCKFSIAPQGVSIDNTLYSFDNLKSFWIFYNPPVVQEISLRSKKSLMPYIKIPLGGQNPRKIKEILSSYLPEKRHKESLVDNLARLARF